MTYCDYNATAPLRPEARDAMLMAMDAQANASSVHQAGRNARRMIEAARLEIGGVIGSRAEDIVFTSGGTEANALALRGALAKLENPVLVYSDLEHPAVRDIALSGVVPTLRIGVLPTGVIDLDDLGAKLSTLEGQTPLLTLMLANNETGVVQPVAEAAEIVRRSNGFTHCDAVQAAGKLPVSVGLLGVDYLSMSAHKTGGPQGVGAMWLRAGAPLLPQQIGGGQEKSIRSGTENLIGIAGFGAAVAASDPHADGARIRLIRDAFENAIAETQSVIFGQSQTRLPGTCCFALDGFKGETQVMALDLAGFAVSSGSACSSGKVKTSSVLTAMGVEEKLAKCALRVSFGWSSELKDAIALANAWKTAAKRAAPDKFKEIA